MATEMSRSLGLRSGSSNPRMAGVVLQDLQTDDSQRYARHAAEQPQQRGLPQHHVDDPPAFPADGEQDANLMGALEHGHEHRVHHAEDADEDGQQRGAPAHGPRDAKSLARGHHFAGHHGAAFGQDFLDLLAEPVSSSLVVSGVTRRSMKLTLPSIAGDLLEHRQGQDDRAVFHHGRPSTIPTTASSSASICSVSPTFFFSTSAAMLAQDDGVLVAVAWACDPRSR